MIRSRALLFAGACIATCYGPVSQAQTASAEPVEETAQDLTGVAEILVTAQRRSENLQQTPIAITAFSSEVLEQKGISSVNDLARTTPSFNYKPSSVSSLSTLISIRGLGQNDLLLTYQPSVALYFDGVYTSKSSGTILQSGLFDVERVEVLKGPQGTLFGRNSTGGAVSVITRLPTSDLEATTRMSVGNLGRMSFDAMVNLPIGDVGGLRVVGQFYDDEGYGRDVRTGRDLNDRNYRTARGTLLLRPSDRFEMILRAEYSQSDTGGTGSKLLNFVPGSNANIEAALEYGLLSPAVFGRVARGQGTPADLAAYSTGLTAAYTRVLATLPSGRYDMITDRFANEGDNESYGGSLTLAYDLTDDIQLKSITTYRDTKDYTVFDSDGADFLGATNAPFRQRAKQRSQEFQLNGSLFDNRVRFASGAFWYKLTGQDLLISQSLPMINPRNPASYDARITDESYSGYAQATVELIENLSFTGGLRYTSEKVVLDSRNATAAGCATPPADRLPGEACLARFPNEFTNWSYTAGLDYQVSSALLLYAKISTGFKAGGQNELGQTTREAFPPFAPEKAKTYEIGIKSDLLDRRLRINAAAYYTDFTDIQRTTFVLVGNSPASRVGNAASARIQGFEVEVSAVPADGLNIDFAASYTDPKYKEYLVLDRSGALVDRSGDRFPSVPNWQLSGGIAYTHDVGIGSLRFGLDASYQSGVLFEVTNRSPLTGPRAGKQDGFTLLNGRITLDIDDEGFQASAFVRNITNKYYFVGGSDLSSLLGVASSFPGAPRSWGLELTKRW